MAPCDVRASCERMTAFEMVVPVHLQHVEVERAAEWKAGCARETDGDRMHRVPTYVQREFGQTSPQLCG